MTIMTGIIYILASWKALDLIFSTAKEVYIAFKLYRDWKKQQNNIKIKK